MIKSLSAPKPSPAHTHPPGDLTIEGYASLFASPDLCGDVVHRGAFALSLARGAGAIAMLFQHDPSEPIGMWDSAFEDRTGLFMRGRIFADGARGRVAHRLVRKGLVDGLSIGFRARGSRRLSAKRRDLFDVELREVSIVTFPMAPQARLRVVEAHNHAAAHVVAA